MAGCFFRLLILPVCIAITSLLFCVRFPGPVLDYTAPGTVAACVVSGCFLWFIWLSVLDIRRFSRDRYNLIHPDYQEGAPFVVAGPVTSHEALLTAPFSGEPCVGYWYQVTHISKSSRSSTEWTDYEGYALVPSVIQTVNGEFPILAEPDSELFYNIKNHGSRRYLPHAKEYFADTEFAETVHGPGHFKVDKLVGKETPLDRCRFEEKILRDGDIMLLSGIYSMSPSGVAPHSDDIIHPFKLVPDGEAGLLKIIRNRWIGMGVTSVLIGITVVIFLVASP